MTSKLLSDFKANTGNLANLMIVDERSDVVPLIIVSRVRWYQRRLTVGFVKVTDKLGEELVSRDAHGGRVAQFMLELLSNMLSQVAC